MWIRPLYNRNRHWFLLQIISSSTLLCLFFVYVFDILEKELPTSDDWVSTFGARPCILRMKVYRSFTSLSWSPLTLRWSSWSPTSPSSLRGTTKRGVWLACISSIVREDGVVEDTTVNQGIVAVRSRHGRQPTPLFFFSFTYLVVNVCCHHCYPTFA